MAKPPKKGPSPKIQQKPQVKPVVKTDSEVATIASIPISENTFIYSVLAAFFVIGLIGVFHHEMWRDELQIWLVGSSAHKLY